MIVAGMTEKELTKEVLSDMRNAFHYDDLNQNKFRRGVLKASRFPVYSHYTYVSPRRNRWYILLEARSKKEIGDDARITLVTTHNTSLGVYAILVSFFQGKPFLILFSPHFFSRYRERMQLPETGEKLILRYFKKNNSFVFDKSIRKEEIIFSELAGSSLDGVAFGFQTEEHNILFKTFVTYEMLKGEQVETYMKNEELRKEIHDR